jgi:hypothetical protein
MTAKILILERLKQSGSWLAVHELNIIGISDNAAATRLSELAKQGKVVSRFRTGKRFKEWAYKGAVSYQQEALFV